MLGNFGLLAADAVSNPQQWIRWRRHIKPFDRTKHKHWRALQTQKLPRPASTLDLCRFTSALPAANDCDQTDRHSQTLT